MPSTCQLFWNLNLKEIQILYSHVCPIDISNITWPKRKFWSPLSPTWYLFFPEASPFPLNIPIYPITQLSNMWVPLDFSLSLISHVYSISQICCLYAHNISLTTFSPITLVQDTIISCVVCCHSLLTGLCFHSCHTLILPPGSILHTAARVIKQRSSLPCLRTSKGLAWHTKSKLLTRRAGPCLPPFAHSASATLAFLLCLIHAKPTSDLGAFLTWGSFLLACCSPRLLQDWHLPYIQVSAEATLSEGPSLTTSPKIVPLIAPTTLSYCLT